MARGDLGLVGCEEMVRRVEGSVVSFFRLPVHLARYSILEQNIVFYPYIIGFPPAGSANASGSDIDNRPQ